MKAQEEIKKIVQLVHDDGETIDLDPVADFIWVGDRIVAIEGLAEAQQLAEAVNAGKVNGGDFGLDDVTAGDIEAEGFLSLEDFLKEIQD